MLEGKNALDFFLLTIARCILDHVKTQNIQTKQAKIKLSKMPRSSV
jgi:hypothetical protein